MVPDIIVKGGNAESKISADSVDVRVDGDLAKCRVNGVPLADLMVLYNKDKGVVQEVPVPALYDSLYDVVDKLGGDKLRFECLPVARYGLAVKNLRDVCNADAVHNVQPVGNRAFSVGEIFLARLIDSDLWKVYLDSCTGFVTKKGSSLFKIVPKCKELVEIASDFRGDFLPIVYDDVEGEEFDGRKYNRLMTEKQALKDKAWLVLCDNRNDLKEQYVGEVFSDGRIEGMGVWTVQNALVDQLRAACVCIRNNGSSANGNVNLGSGARFARVALK